MSRHPWVLTTLSPLLPLLAAATVWGATVEENPFPVFESGTATLVVGDQRSPLGYSLTAAGPLFALPPIVGRLGGSLSVGPLEQSHRLTVDDREFVFGPGSSAVTAGEEIVELPQAPAPAIDGLRVPLEFLETVYGDLLGYEFPWNREARTLTVDRRPRRDFPVAIDLVDLQGVTTAVLQFSEQPRYRIEESPGAIEVQLVGDRLEPSPDPRVSPESLVRGVVISAKGVRLSLAPGTQAESYILRRPFRLVFDVYRGGTPQAPGIGAVAPPRRRQGIRTIVLDPGHGGGDTGAIGDAGSLEKELTLFIAQRLRRALEARLPVKVVLTRDEDAELPLDTRTSLANQNKADLFISLHLNSAFAPGAHGAETYFASLEASDERAAQAAAEENQTGTGEASADPLFSLQLILWDLAQSQHLAESQKLAKLIQDELNQELGLRNRGVKQAPFRVLMGAAMPAVLVELGFISNPTDEDRLRDPAYRGQLVDALVRAVSRYKAATDLRPEPIADEALR